MFMQVDLPDPDGPITATNSPSLHGEVDPGERRDFGFATAHRSW
jgi:hypothetical protein